MRFWENEMVQKSYPSKEKYQPKKKKMVTSQI